MRLTKRDGVLARIDRLLDEWRTGRGVSVVMSGPVGCGKTVLLQEVAERTADRGGALFSVTASQSERHHAAGLIDQLARLLRAAGMADPGEGPVGSPRGFFAWLEGLCRAVCDFAEQRRIVITIDDVHFADGLSLAGLGYLIRRIEHHPVMVILAESPCHEPNVRALHAETLHLAYTHRIMLNPLTPAGVTELLTARFGGPPPADLAELCASAGGGNPLLVQALIEDHSAREAAPDEPVPGTWFRHAVLRCLHRCTPEMLAAAQATAVLGEFATPDLIAELIGTDPASVGAALLELRATGLLTGAAFHHEVARLAVLGGIPVHDAPTLYGRAAELLHDSGAPAVAVVERLLAAHGQVKAAWWTATLREAVGEAMAAGNVQDAVRHLRNAASLPAEAEDLAQFTALLADAQWHLDPPTAARYLPELARNVRAGLLTGADALVPVRLLAWQGDLADAAALLQLIDGTAAPNDPRIPPAAQTQTAARWWINFCRAAATGAPADEPGRRPGPFALWSVPVAALFQLPFPVDGADEDEWHEIAERLLQGLAPGSLTRALVATALLIQLDRPGDAMQCCDRLLGQSWVRQVPMYRAAVEAVKAVAALRRGEVAVAATAARAAVEVVGPQGWGIGIGVPVAVLVNAALEQSDLEAAESHLSLPVPQAIFATPFALPYLQAAGRYHLAAGKPHTALAHFRFCGELAGRWRLDVPDLADWRNDAAAALTAVGRHAEARELIDEQLVRLGDRRSRARGIALRRLAAASGAALRPAILREAIETLAAVDDRLELGRAQAMLIEALQADRHRPRPNQRRDTAVTAAPGNDGAVAGIRPAGPGEDDDGLAGLTDAERRVAALAAAGATNRQIADRLFITVSTVEQHLTKIYRKLDVRRRSGLPADLLRNTP